MRLLATELRKMLTLPGTYVALAVGVLGPTPIAALNAFSVRNALAAGRPKLVGYTSAADALFSAVPLGTICAVILGVLVISSEYAANRSDAGSGRQLTTTLAATPSRLRLLAAKALTLVLLLAVVAAVTIPAGLAVATTIVGAADETPMDLSSLMARSFGAWLYWTLTALIALAITVLTRSGVIPLIVLIVNSSLVSLSLLLSKLTPLARYLPDIAGARLFASQRSMALQETLDPVTGGLVMSAWSVGLLAVAAATFKRRDA
jgi:ABC-2 type transport system permease protein